MLRATRQFLEENFIKDQTITGATVYKYNPGGYWQLCVNMTYNCIDMYQGEVYGKIILGKDKQWAINTNAIYTKFFREMKKYMDFKKLKPKRMNVKEFTKLLKRYNLLEGGMNELMKKYKAKYNEILMKEDFE